MNQEKPKQIKSIARVRKENPKGKYFVYRIKDSRDVEEPAYPFEGRIIKMMGLRKGEHIEVTFKRIRSNT